MPNLGILATTFIPKYYLSNYFLDSENAEMINSVLVLPWLGHVCYL
jgi:hypothetical protein